MTSRKQLETATPVRSGTDPIPQPQHFLTFPMWERISGGVKLSNKGRYAVRALFDIAFYNQGRPTQVKDIAERQDIPPRFLEQIFQDLKRAGLVGSKRGPQGGYSLLRSPLEVSVGEILRVTDGPVQLTDAAEDEPVVSGSCRQATESIFGDLSARVESCLDGVTLADICSRAEQLGVRKPGSQKYSYVI